MLKWGPGFLSQGEPTRGLQAVWGPGFLLQGEPRPWAAGSVGSRVSVAGGTHLWAAGSMLCQGRGACGPGVSQNGGADGPLRKQDRLYINSVLSLPNQVLSRSRTHSEFIVAIVLLFIFSIFSIRN